MKTKLTVLLILIANLTYSQQKFRNFYTSVNNADKKEGIALILANDNYINIGKLEFAEDDGRHMINALKEVDYDIEIGLNLNEDEMIEAINAFASKLSKYKNAVIYYSGHGVELEGKNYILPTDVSGTDALSFKNSAIDLTTLFFAIDNPTIPKVIILDACREAPVQFKAKKRLVKGGGLAEVEARTNSFIVFSTAPNTSISDDNNFTEVLSANIKKGGCINEVVRKTRKSILEEDPKQLIYEDGTLLDDICFGDKQSVTVNIDDYDNDGVADEFDNCPNESGPVSNYGCPFNTKIYKKDKFLFSKNNLVGYTDTKGNTAIPAKFDLGWPFYENRARVLKDAAWHYIDKTGKVITKKTYDSITTFKNRVGIVKINNLFGAIDSLGNELTNIEFSSLKHSAGSRYLIYSKLINGKERWGLLDNLGNLLLQPIYESDFEFSDGMASAIRNGRLVFFNTKGEVLFSGNYVRADLFVSGSVIVELPNKTYQILDRTGKVIENLVSERQRKFKKFPSPYKNEFQLSSNEIKESSGRRIFIDLYVSYKLLNENNDIIIEGKAYNIIYDGDLLYVLGEKDSKSENTLNIYDNDGTLLKTFSNIASHYDYFHDKIRPRSFGGFGNENGGLKDFSVGFWGKIVETDSWKYYYLFNNLSTKLSLIGCEIKLENIPQDRNHFIVFKPSTGKYGVMNAQGEIKVPIEFNFMAPAKYRYDNNYKNHWSKFENSYEVIAEYDENTIYITSERLWWNTHIMTSRTEKRISQLGLTKRK